MKKSIHFLSLAVFITVISCNNEERSAVDKKTVNEKAVETKKDADQRNDIEVPLPPPPPRPPSPKEIIKKLPTPPLPPAPPRPPRPPKPGGG